MSAPEFKLVQISIIMLGTTDLARAVAFYRDRLGLEVRNQVPGFAFLNAGQVTLCLSEPHARVVGNELKESVEIVFPVDSVRTAYERLKAQGVTFTHEPRNVSGPSWSANFNDPDGHKLSVFGNE